MKITLLTVGKTDRDWVRQGLDIYVSRLKHYIPFVLTEIPELKNVSYPVYKDFADEKMPIMFGSGVRCHVFSLAGRGSGQWL